MERYRPSQDLAVAGPRLRRYHVRVIPSSSMRQDGSRLAAAAGGGAPPRLASVAACLALPLVLLSCAPQLHLTVAMDEAFAAARPGLTNELERLRPAGFTRRNVRVGLDESPAKAFEYVDRRAGARRTDILIASPFLASTLQGRLGAIPIIALEWEAQPAPGLSLIMTDPLPAYRAAGRAAGAYIAAIRGKSGGNPSCGVVYSSSPSRPRAALEAFAAAYEASSGAAPLLVRALPPPSSTEGSADADAQAAVGELLGSDMRLLFVAAGRATPAAIKAAAAPDIAVGADILEPQPLPQLSFMIVSDDAALARAAGKVLERWNRTRRGSVGPVERGDPGGPPVLVPSLLLEGPAAAHAAAGLRPFSAYLRSD